jgi:MFS transporter, DHA1 family, tetracycline resistance protein
MKNKILLTLFIIVFLDLLGLGIVLPILAPLILDSSHNLLAPETNEVTRGIVLGFLFAIYPLTQFFGAPILGALSDHHGRKKILTISLAGTLVGYLIFAYGIVTRDIYLLFISRAIDGFTGGNIAVAQSAIADISSNKDKVKNFGLIGMAFGLGFILGPFVGGVLSDPKLVSWFDFATPFWFAAILILLSIIMVLTMFKETIITTKKTKVSLLSSFINIKKAVQIPHLRIMFLVIFLLIFGFSFFTQFFPVFLFQKFHLDQAHIGNIFAYIGLWSAIAQGFILRPLSKKFSSATLLSASSVVMFIALLIIILPENVSMLLFILPFIAISRGISQPNSTAIISNMTKPEEQGEILGINQSITALAHAIPPIIAGFIVTFNLAMPIIAASISIIAAWLVFTLILNQKEINNKIYENQ